VTRPAISQAQAWQPESLSRLADGWNEAARLLVTHIDSVMRDVHRTRDFWSGATADAARDNADGIAAVVDDAARCLVVASVAAQDGADQIAAAQTTLRTCVAEARDDEFEVADDGSVSIRAGPSPLLVALSGGAPEVAHTMLAMQADELTTRSTARLVEAR